MRIDPDRPGFLAILAGEAGPGMRVYAWTGGLTLSFLLAVAGWTLVS